MLSSHDVHTTLGRLRVFAAGEGPAMLMWPCLLTNADLWCAQVEHFSSRFRVITIDPPGHGDSAPLASTFTVEDCAQAMCDVLDHFGIDRAHILGTSWGGMVGGTFAALHPERAGIAVLLNATATPASTRQRIRYRILLRAARTFGGIRGPLSRPVLSSLLGKTSRRHRPEVVRRVREAIRRLDFDSSTWAIQSVLADRPDQRATFGAISAPVLVVAGSQDRTFTMAESHTVAESIPGADFVVIDTASHLAALETPECVNALIEEFFEQHINHLV